MKPSALIISFLLMTIMVILCNYFVDAQVAIFVNSYFYRNSSWARYTSNISDVLLLVVCIISVVAWIAYFLREKKGIFDVHTRFFQLAAYAVPASYVAKSALKYLFGRINTREWLLHPDLYGFHWLHGGARHGGFPSGHMAVFTTLIAGLWRFYPRYRHAYLIIMVLLASALIATDYHFVSDVIAGSYLGIIVEAATFRLLLRRYPFHGCRKSLP
jgi:membrane-associated phospholipid phosphatase